MAMAIVICLNLLALQATQPNGKTETEMAMVTMHQAQIQTFVQIQNQRTKHTWIRMDATRHKAMVIMTVWPTTTTTVLMNQQVLMEGMVTVVQLQCQQMMIPLKACLA